MPTRTQLRQRLAQDLRAFKPDEGGVATGGTASTLIQAGWPIQKNLDKSSEFDGWYLLRPTTVTPGDRVRMILPGGYAPRSGTFTPNLPYTTSPSAAPPEAAFEIHGHGFEPWAGIDLLLNAALREINVVTTVPFAPRIATAGNYAQNLTDGDGSGTVNTRIPSLLHPRWVHKIEHLPTAARQVQTLTIANGSTTTYHVVYRGVSSGVLNTTDTAAVVQTALRLVPGMEAVTVAQSGSTPNFTNTVTMAGCPLQSPLMATAIDSGSGTVTSAITTEMGIGVPQTGRVDLDSGHVLFYADRRYDAGDYLYITCEIPAYYWCRASSTARFGSLLGIGTRSIVAATGMEASVSDNHEALPQVEWVSAQAQVFAWERYTDIMQKGLDERHIADQAAAQAKANDYRDRFLRSVQYDEENLRYPVDGGPTQPDSAVRALSKDLAPATPGRN